jgi:hypothetical protein
MTKSALTESSTPSTVQPGKPPANILSRLPAELRHMVYSDLNFPVGGYIWIDCPYDYYCPHASHFHLRFNGKYSRKIHAEDGVFEVRVRLKKLQFSRFDQTLQGVHADLDSLSDSGSGSSDSPYFEKEKPWYLVEGNMLRVNKAMRTELLELLYGRTEVEFFFALSEERVFQGPHEKLFYGRRDYGVPSLRLLPSTLTYMTSVTIPVILYERSEKNNTCRSFLFVAKYATNLRRLTCLMRSLSRVPEETIALFAQTLNTVTVTVKSLQMLRFVGHERKLGRFKRKNRGTSDEEIILERIGADIAVSEIRGVLDELRKK